MRHILRDIFRHKLAASIFTFALCFMMITGPAHAQTRDGGMKREAEWTSTWTGPFTCEAVNASTNSNVAHITTNNELRLNYTPPSTPDSFAYTAASGTKPRVLVGIPDTDSTVTTDNSSSLNSLNWTSTKAIAAVLIGGSGGNRLYWMPEGMAFGNQFSGTNFRNPAGSAITKVAFCYHQPATVTIIKEVQSPAGLAAFSSSSFPFTVTGLGSGFSLVDNNSAGPDRRVIENLYKFAKWGNYNLTVTESLGQFWSFADLKCTETDTVSGQTQYATTVNLSSRKATIQLEEGENVTCTYKNTLLAPTAGTGSLSGRITDSNGNGLAKIKVTAVSAASGESNETYTNRNGFYSFSDLPVAEFYTLSVEHERYSFTNSSIVFTLLDDMEGLNFMANPKE